MCNLRSATGKFVAGEKDCKCGGEDFFWKSTLSKQHLYQTFLILHVQTNFDMEVGEKLLLYYFDSVDLQK